MITEICLGQKDAEDFCLAVYHWVHFLDDVQDGEVAAKWPMSAIVEVNLRAAWTFATNPFFQLHRAEFLALMTQGALAWEDSEEWITREDERDRAAAGVLKGGYHTIFWHVAFRTGGTEHARAMTKKYRAFSYDLPSAKPE